MRGNDMIAQAVVFVCYYHWFLNKITDCFGTNRIGKLSKDSRIR